VRPVLITGGAGFIGSALVRTLVARETRVVNFDKLTYAGNLDSLPETEGAPNHVFVQGDVAHAGQVRNAFEFYRPAAVVHLAAESHVDRSIDGPGAFIETNIVGTFTLLDEALRYWRTLPAADAANFRFIHVSTDEVFGSLGNAGAFSESSPYQPNSPYAATKAAADHLVRAWCTTYGLPAIITNCSNNYGPYQFPEKLIPLTIQRALALQSLPVYGRGENVRDWLYVQDHVSALLAVLERGGVGETYVIGGGEERRNIDVVRTVCALLDEMSPDPRIGDRSGLIEFVADRPGHDHRYATDSSRLRTALSWSPSESFESGLRRTVAWYLANQVWCARVQSGEYRGQRLGLQVREA
jgi:dTDP-glucose 4,6-dehydratase